MRSVIESALVDAEVIRQNMLADFMTALLEVAPALAKAAAFMDQAEKEDFYAQTIAAIAADVLSDHAGDIEENAELTVDNFARAVLGNGS